jgi:hypothetical protein
MRYILSVVVLICFASCAKKMVRGEQNIMSATQTLLLEHDSLILARGETRGQVMVAAGKRVNYKNGIYLLQTDLGILKRYGYHKKAVADEALKAKFNRLLSKAYLTDVGTFAYSQLPPATIKYYYLGKLKFDIPTGYYSNEGDRRHIQGYSADIAVPVFVVTDIEEGK